MRGAFSRLLAALVLPGCIAVPARGCTPAGFAVEIGSRLPDGYVREPSYRPFFILGEVAAPGRYPYVFDMNVESAIAIAGGVTPRARRDRVTPAHTDGSGSLRYVKPLGTALGPEDTVQVGERWL